MPLALSQVRSADLDTGYGQWACRLLAAPHVANFQSQRKGDEAKAINIYAIGKSTGNSIDLRILLALLFGKSIFCSSSAVPSIGRMVRIPRSPIRNETFYF